MNDNDNVQDICLENEMLEGEEAISEEVISDLTSVEHTQELQGLEQRQRVIEAALFAAGEPLSVDKLAQLFDESAKLSRQDIKTSLLAIAESLAAHSVELVEVGSGYRLQVEATYSPWLKRLWEKKPPRYSRALLETLALIVYRQPITRGEIESVRGVAVSSHIMKTLLDREWVKIVGYRDVPGKPALFASTKQFLDDFNLKHLDELPPLKELVDIEDLDKKIGQQLALNMGATGPSDNVEPQEGDVESMVSEAEAETETETETAVDTESLVEGMEQGIENTPLSESLDTSEDNVSSQEVAHSEEMPA